MTGVSCLTSDGDEWHTVQKGGRGETLQPKGRTARTLFMEKVADNRCVPSHLAWAEVQPSCCRLLHVKCEGTAADDVTGFTMWQKKLCATMGRIATFEESWDYIILYGQARILETPHCFSYLRQITLILLPCGVTGLRQDGSLCVFDVARLQGMSCWTCEVF